jgi:ABC-type Zn uptake system ZnuABC Zn-binding protein ZnuA
LILINGLKLEDPTLDLAQKNKKAETEIVELGTVVLPESDYIYDFSFPKEEGKPNPHLWTDPGYAIKYAGVIRDQLSKLDPENADYYADRISLCLSNRQMSSQQQLKLTSKVFLQET